MYAWHWIFADISKLIIHSIDMVIFVNSTTALFILNEPLSFMVTVNLCKKRKQNVILDELNWIFKNGDSVMRQTRTVHVYILTSQTIYGKSLVNMYG